MEKFGNIYKFGVQLLHFLYSERIQIMQDFHGKSGKVIVDVSLLCLFVCPHTAQKITGGGVINGRQQFAVLDLARS